MGSLLSLQQKKEKRQGRRGRRKRTTRPGAAATSASIDIRGRIGHLGLEIMGGLDEGGKGG